MPPLFRPLPRWPQASSTPGPRWRPLVPIGLAAIAAGLTLLLCTSKRPVDAGATLIPSTRSAPSRGLSALLRRHQAKPPTLTVPPPVIPQPLPPQQAWPAEAVVQAEPSFDDLNTSHWAWPLLADLAQRNLVSGFPDGTFRPGAAMTRAEFAAQLTHLFDFPPDRSLRPALVNYPDVKLDHWAYKSVQKTVSMGFLGGHPDGTFLPDQTVSRIQVIVALANGLTLKSSRAATEALAPYVDRDQVPIWAIRQLVAATDAGLVVNYPEINTLAPNRPASRAEVAAMLHRSLVYTGSLQTVPSPYIVEKARVDQVGPP
ncbi:S-layer homology domain-containing protein [Leptolyngbya sp. CCNP1308]|uniref:S-layer homology domain-containing protein n=1 Tax=Leptolyngbya sp. CCNP1308 TaxID=3110255 RepID=UPI002B1FA442|nr:S-layer homology domain-containing protein [Leptolyngbya sp. CCNP1308]MEA5448983.1 S-layer homology domain-containing protein [Leptolyngbya sp. CCNP1308]